MVNIVKERERLIHLLKRPYYEWVIYRQRKKREVYFNELRNIITPETSIISPNCFAGRIMQDLGMKYNTPTLGLYFWAEDYIEFLSHIDHYLHKSKLTFVDHSKYPYGNDFRAKREHWYPIGVLDGKVEIVFLHYHTEEEAAEKWYRRAARVNMDDLVVIGMNQNLCEEKDILAFDRLPFKRKIFFSSKPVKGDSIVFVKEFEGQDQVGDPYQCGHIFYKYLTEKLK